MFVNKFLYLRTVGRAGYGTCYLDMLLFPCPYLNVLFFSWCSMSSSSMPSSFLVSTTNFAVTLFFTQTIHCVLGYPGVFEAVFFNLYTSTLTFNTQIKAYTHSFKDRRRTHFRNILIKSRTETTIRNHLHGAILCDMH